MTRFLTTGSMLLLLFWSAAPGAQRLTPEQVIERHAAGSLPGDVGAARTRTVRGGCTATAPARIAGQLAGDFRLVAGADRFRLTLQFDNDRYHGETITYEAGRVEVGFAQPRTTSRSALGNFLSVNRPIVEEGLLGGVLNGRWPLLERGTRSARLQYEGLKKLAGRELHRMRYRAREGQGGLEVQLYFEPESFRHAASVYTASQTQAIGFTPESSSREQDQHFRLEETFSDFVTLGQQTVPRTWTLRYERTGNTSTEWKYSCTVAAFDDHELPTTQASAALSSRP